MRKSWTKRLAGPLFATSLAACGDSTGAGPGSVDPLELALDFCSNTGEFPVFFAHLNEGQGWTRVNGDGNRTFRFRASDKVGVAMIFFSDGAGWTTEILFVKREELEPLSGIACPEAGTKSVHGSVAGAATFDLAYVAMGVGGASGVYVDPPPSTFTLFDLPNAPRDLVAHAFSEQISGDPGNRVFTGEVPDAVIIRRAQNPTNGATLAALDFNSAEAAIPSTNTVTIAGLSASEYNTIELFFSTATMSTAFFFRSLRFTSGTQTIYHVPSSVTQAGDLHRLDVWAGSDRFETQFYRNASNRSVSLGPKLGVPTFTTVQSSPVVRRRAEFAVQPEYNSFAQADFVTGGNPTRTVAVLGTAGFFDSPSTWTLEIPDLTGVSGFPTVSGLPAPGGPSAAAFGGDLAAFFRAGHSRSFYSQAAPVEGSSIKFATWYPPAVSTMLALRSSQPARREGRRAVGLQLGRHKFGVR